MRFTMRVYEVDSKTGRVVRERGRVAVGASDRGVPLMTSAYPPCQCRRCRAEDKGR